MKKILLPLVTSMVVTVTLSAYADGSTGSMSYKGTTTKEKVNSSIGTLSGTFDITSNYMFRGISNSNNVPAFQGGLTYQFTKTGIYFNIWGSNVNFSDPLGNTATVEIDTIAGIRNSIGDNFTYDINVDRYNYPKARAADYDEIIANATFYFLTAQIAYSSNVYGFHDNGTYVNIGFNYPVPPHFIFGQENVVVSGGIGHYSLNPTPTLQSYNDYNIQIAKTIGSYTLAVQWTDTNGRSVDPVYLRDSHIIGTVTANF